MAADRTSPEYRRARLRLVTASDAEQQKARPALPAGAAGGEFECWMKMAADELTAGRLLATEIDLLATAARARMTHARAQLLADSPRQVALAELGHAERDLEALIALLKPTVGTSLPAVTPARALPLRRVVGPFFKPGSTPVIRKEDPDGQA
jgi:hypothetical protein